jgi:hypothetical protein
MQRPPSKFSGFVCFGAAIVATAIVSGAERSKTSTTVDEVLRKEVLSVVDRRLLLQDSLNQSPHVDQVRWHSGFIHDGREWRFYDELATDPVRTRKLERYHEKRDAAPTTPEAQLSLATWCRQNGLIDEERAHLWAALNLVPENNDPTLLKRLGFQRVGPFWISRREIDEWREMNRVAESSLKKWNPQVNSIAKRLAGSRPQRDSALLELQKIDDPAAVPALEMALSDASPANELDLLQAIARHRDCVATEALARQAVYSESAQVRAAATTALETRKYEDFVPQLIHLLATPAEMQSHAQFTSRGALFFSYVICRETDTEFQVARMQAACRLFPTYQPAYNAARTGVRAVAPALNRAQVERTLNDVAIVVGDRLRDEEKRVARHNERTALWNERIGTVLASLSGEPQTAADTPQHWWSWWSNYGDTLQTAPKQVVRVDEEEQYNVPVLQIVPMSCFAAGTIVWTESGPAGIEQIRPGDRVLSQSVDTGELALKVVIRTSVRPPKDLLRLQIGDETLLTTSGHRFWVCGEGWIKARDLKLQSLVHTATGNVLVRAVESAPTAETYNLVVDDFHTYFVGDAGLLVQDLPLPRPTDCVVPGLPRRKLAASSP